MGAILTATGRRVFYDDLGIGPALLMMPGGVGSRRGIYTPLVHVLATRYRVIAMDHRDTGESEPEADYYTIGDMTADAVALLDALAIRRAHIMGHSSSGLIALQMALDHGDRINRMVLLSTFAMGDQSHRAGEPMPPPKDWWDDDPTAWVRRVLLGVVGPDSRDRLTETEISGIAEMERGNRATWLSVLHRRAALSADLSDSLADITAPTLVIHGDADPVVPNDRASALAACIPNARLVLLPGVGHLPWLEQPDKATSVILGFLKEADEGAQ